jgi:hypothetical protein
MSDNSKNNGHCDKHSGFTVDFENDLHPECPMCALLAIVEELEQEIKPKETPTDSNKLWPVNSMG